MNRLQRSCGFAVVIGAVTLAGIAARPVSAAFTINLIAPTNIDPRAKQGFQSAATLWQNVFSDNITINIQVDFAALPSGVIGQTNPFGDRNNSDTSFVASYAQLRTALVGDLISPDDATATANLQIGSALDFVTNDVNGSSVVDTDGSANNSFFQLSGANAKALGLVAADRSLVDAFVEFSNRFSFDFNPADGITPGQVDFVGVAAHEIGHALGFLSGVDTVDALSGPNLEPGQTATDLNDFVVFNPLDLYRYSNSFLTLVNGQRVQDLRQGQDRLGNTITPFFSIDRTTSIARFATGPFDGDGNQASHWKDNLGLGIMDPTAGPGERLQISENDLRAFDVIGYNLSRFATATAPEPATILLLALGLFAGNARRRRLK